MKELTKEWIDQADYKTLLIYFRQPAKMTEEEKAKDFNKQLGGYLIIKLCEKKFQLSHDEWEKINAEVEWDL